VSLKPAPIAAAGEPRYLRPGGNREVRRRRQRRTVLRASLWCCLWLAGAALAAFGFREGWLLLAGPGRFQLERVIVQGAGDKVDGEIEAQASHLLGRNLLTIDIADLEKIARSHPWVRTASVWRRLPSAVLVVVEPRKVAALVLAGDGVHMVDAGGSDLGRYEPGYAADNRPVLTGVMDAGGRASPERLLRGIGASLRLEETSPEFAATLSTLDLSRTDRLTATLRDFRPPVYLSPEDPLRNLDRLAGVRERLTAAGIDVDYVDLRFRNRIAVMPVRTGETTSGA
jgi:cell division septal protein FtsQ